MNAQQDLYNQAISKLVEFIVAACHENPDMNLEVFVHKAEKLQDDDKIGKPPSFIFYTLSCQDSRRQSYVSSENFRQIDERIQDRLSDMSSEYVQVPLNFHLTSVYDHSLHEAFSRVLHKLIGTLPYLEELLNVFCAVHILTDNRVAHRTLIGLSRTHSHLKPSYLTQNRGCILLQTHLPLTRRHIISVVTTSKC
jgi:hypothetical protein